MTDSSWRQLQWADARDGWGTPGTTADGTRDTYLITEIDGHIVLARWTRRDGPPAPAWWTAREALTAALTIPSTPATETHAAQLAEAYENGTSLTSRAWHHPGTQALPPPRRHQRRLRRPRPARPPGAARQDRHGRARPARRPRPPRQRPRQPRRPGRPGLADQGKRPDDLRRRPRPGTATTGSNLSKERHRP